MLEQEVRKAKEKNGEGENRKGKGNTDRTRAIDCRYNGAEATTSLPVQDMRLYIRDVALRSWAAWKGFKLSRMRWKTQKD